MFVTITLNPAIDYVVHLPHLEKGRINRTEGETLHPGGKGINVALMLQRLGFQTVAIGFAGGFTGLALQKLVEQEGVKTDFVRVKGDTRINVKIRSSEETDLNSRGVTLKTGDLERLFKRLNGLQEGDYLVLSGSVPQGMPENVYAKILRRVAKKNLQVVVDTVGMPLRNALVHRPFLVKPNREEFSELFETPPRTREEMFACAAQLQRMGARNVIVSLAEEGAIMLTETGERMLCRAPSGTLTDSVGSGDSLVAGFLSSYAADQDYAKALTFGVAAGSATAFSPWLGDRSTVEKLVLQTELVRFPQE